MRIDDELYRAVKEQAARTGRTVGEIIEDAIRRSITPDDADSDAPLPPLPVYGGSGVLPGVDLASNAAVRDVMDAESPLMRCVDVNVLVYATTSAIGYGSTTRGQTMSPWGSAISYCQASFAS